MDAVKILGGLLNQRAARAGGSGAVLGQVLNGIAAASANRANVDPRFNDPRFQDPRFDDRHHESFEHLIRDSVGRRHHAGGSIHPQAERWVRGPGMPQYGPQSYGPQGRGRVGLNPPVVQRVPRPRHDVDEHRHGSGLGYNARAELLITAMIMAAQSDGKIDQAEQDRIVSELQPLDRDEVAWLRRVFAKRHDLHDFVHAIPHGMEYEVYQVSLMAIDLDTKLEAAYLRDLAKCLRIDPVVCNRLHHRCGAPTLF